MDLMTFLEKPFNIISMFYALFKPLLFNLSPESAHNFILKMASLSPTLGQISGHRPSEKLNIKVGNCRWLSPVGLAAGLDKNAEALDFFSHQGFGAIECGTVTLRPQMGNPKPRLWRYPQEESLRNAMGFPNLGLFSLASKLKSFQGSLPLGVNLGKNKDSSPEESIQELCLMLSTLNNSADYFVVNVSSPNTPGLRALQETTYLSELFTQLKSISDKDLYLKIAPDLDDDKVLELVKLAVDFKLTGIIATNTTIIPERGSGGVSGKLLLPKSRKMRKLILNQKAPLELIGVGGMSCFEDVKDFWRDGGKAVQLYSSYVFQGPALLKKINQDLIQFLEQNQLKNLQVFFELDSKERQNLL